MNVAEPPGQIRTRRGFYFDVRPQGHRLAHATVDPFWIYRPFGHSAVSADRP